MKRVFIFFTIAAFCISACSCSEEAKNTPLPAPEKPQEQNPGGNSEELFPKDDGVLRLATYNIGALQKSSKTGTALIASMMTELKADVISFNEVDKNVPRSGNVDQLDRIVSGMEEYEYVFAKAINIGNGEYGNGIAYNPAAVGEKVRSFTIPFPNAGEPRVCLVVEFGKIVFASTHLDVSNPSERVAEVTEITRRMQKEFGGKGKPVFLAGDMNEYPTDNAMMKLREDWNMVSVNSNTFPSNDPDRCIDMIFLMDGSGECTKTGSQVCYRFNTGNVAEASDHLPVYADIILSEDNILTK